MIYQKDLLSSTIKGMYQSSQVLSKLWWAYGKFNVDDPRLYIRLNDAVVPKLPDMPAWQLAGAHSADSQTPYLKVCFRFGMMTPLLSNCRFNM